jgi:hypothetical protein
LDRAFHEASERTRVDAVHDEVPDLFPEFVRLPHARFTDREILGPRRVDANDERPTRCVQECNNRPE